ncbi:serine/threonine/tyrosine-interacting protein B-like [Pollicipes pollicipes]|uniref:serine/threonine/tyrosine-interacting protein B-like n=1 Tax=Pollicipes pollicipes TaxID=41117 RepID=UPI001884FDF7|nr:serine/threonine/tyrosine-interacting protein B-like [Pollicipes pollicipes]XP_037069511.1 serine/threonine/tyrosine-interacting protein B-like [Pollicipes pollicipes]
MWPPTYAHHHSSRCKSALRPLAPLAWTYEMRREMQEILPGLFLGPYNAASRTQLDHLQQVGITHIVCVRRSDEASRIRPNFPHMFQYLEVELSGAAEQGVLSHVAPVSAFLDEALCSGGRALVHGNLGISLSAALVVAYVMRRLSLSFGAASSLVAERRYCVHLSPALVHQLHEYEPICRAEAAFLGGHCSGGRRRHKRSCDQLEDDNEPMDLTT